MGGFEQLPQAIAANAEAREILAEDVRPSGELWDDDTALGIVLADAMEGQAYLQSKGLVPLGIESADELVRAFVRPRQWPDGKARANMSMHVTLQAIEKLMPPLFLSLFPPGRKPFLIEPMGNTTPEAARANGHMLYWAIKQSGLKEEMRVSLKTALTYGLIVGFWGWEQCSIRKKVYKQADGKMSGKWKTLEIKVPRYDCQDLRMLIIDPHLKRQSVQHESCRWVIRQGMTNGYGLQELRDNPDYKNIPTDEELAQILAAKTEPTEDSLVGGKRVIWREFQAQLETAKTSKDPLEQPLEILERISADRIVTILQRKIVIRNQENEFARINAQSCSFVDVLGSAWGFGVAKLLAGEQRLQHGILNNWIDSFALVMNPVFQLLKGIGPGTQTIPVSPGKVITETGELKPLVVPDVSETAMNAITSSDLRASEKVGANGGSALPTAALRTAEGVNAFSGDIVQKLQYFMEQFIELVYIPTLEAYLEMLHDHLSPEDVKHILSEEGAAAWEGDISDIYNASLKLDVVAGANMMAKFAVAQLAPLIMQLVSTSGVAQQLEVQSQYFDYGEFSRDVLDWMGVESGEYFKAMTPEMKQAVMQRNQAMQQAAGKIMLQQQKHADDLENIDAKASGQAGVAVVRQTLRNAELEGQQKLNGQGPGSEANSD